MRVLLQLGAGMLLLTGCPGRHSGQGDSASAGADSEDTNPDLPPGETVVFEGVSPGSAGESVAGAGDVDGDGYDDLLIGSGNDLDNPDGAAFLVLGSEAPVSMSLSSSDATFTAEAADQWAGSDVAGVGDVDGDGFDDMLVGAALNAEEVGAAYLILGGADVASIGLGSADVKFTGASTGSWFGAGVSGAGDVNADGHADLLISAWGYYNPYAGQTRKTAGSYLFLGGSLPGAVSGADAYGSYPSSGFEADAAGVGDVNADGFDDFLVGVAAEEVAYLVLGGASPAAAVADVDVRYANKVSDLVSFGDVVSGAGDVNGDGYADMLIEAPSSGDFGGRGAVVLILGGAAPVDMDATEAAAEYTGSGGEVLRSIAPAGDRDLDGFDDVLVGAGSNGTSTTGGYDQGVAYVFRGSAAPVSAVTSDVGRMYVGDGSAEAFGSSVALAGDANADGYPDLLIGAAARRGKAYLLLGP